MLRKFNLSEVNKGDLERVYEYLVKKNLSQSRINSIMKVALIPLKNAYKKGLILNRCFDFLLPKKTDDKMYLSNSQIVKIFNSDWNDTEAFLANLIAYECKMQLQEVRALRLIDIKTNEIVVNNCYSNSKGLIPCDNKRAVNISSLLNFAILKYLSTAPYSDFKPEDYVFYSEQRDRPAHAKFWTKELQTICKKKLHIKKPVDFRIWSRVN